jgi:hypothetical protein
VWPIVARRRSHQVESFGAIECPDDEQVRKAFNIREAKLKFSPYLENPFRLVLGT